MDDINNNDNYDNILVEATNSEDENDSIINAKLQQLKSLQSLLKSSVKPEEDFIENLVSIVKKTVRQEDSLIRQLLYTAFSAFSKDPINLGIMAPTSEGKTHVATETLQYFPTEDVWKIGSMTPKVIIRQNGILVDENNEPVEDNIKDLKIKIAQEKDENKKAELKDHLIEIYKNAKILIDLRNKIFLFLEPPHPETWNILKPILSHDSKEIEHPYVFKVEGHGFQVKKIIARGWPACIFCSAKNESNWPVWPEIQSRFLITSPNMVKQKYEESNMLIAQTKGLPKSIQKQIIISEKEKEIAKTCVLYLKEKIKNRSVLLLSSTTEQYNFEFLSVWIPYYEILASALPSEKGTDVRVFKRIFSFLELLPLIKSESRFKILYGSELLVVASIEDLAEVLYMTQDLNGIPPYKMQFFKNVFIPLYKSKDKPDEKEDKKEQRIAVTSKELADYYKAKQGKAMTESNIKKTYLAEFLQNGLVDEANSVIDGRYKIYYPLVEFLSVEKEDKEKYENYRNLDHSHNLFQYCKLIPSKYYIKVYKRWLKLQLLNLIKYGNDTDNFQFSILDYKDNNENENEKKICTCQFEKRYEETKYGSLILLFSNAQNCNSYNKIFSDIEYIGIFPKEKDEKLQESCQFLQYSNFDNEEDREKEVIESQSNRECELDNIEDNYDLNKEQTDNSTINTDRGSQATSAEYKQDIDFQTFTEQPFNGSSCIYEVRNTSSNDILNIKDLSDSMDVSPHQTQMQVKHSLYDEDDLDTEQPIDDATNSLMDNSKDAVSSNPCSSYKYTKEDIRSLA